MNKNIKELFFLHFLNDGFRTTCLIMLPFIAKDLSLTYAQSGILGSTQSLIASMLAIPSGFIAARIGGYKLLAFLLIIYSLGSALIGLSPNIFLLIFAYLLGAVGYGMFHTVGFTITAKNSDKTNIGRNMGNFTSTGEIGRVALPPLAILTTSFLGWRITMITGAFIGFLTYAVIRFYTSFKEASVVKDIEKKENHKDFAKEILRLLKMRKFFFLACGAIIDSFASSPVYIYLPFLILSKGMNPIQLGIITAGLFVGSLTGKMILGRFSDILGNSKVFILSELSMALTLILVTLFPYFLLLLLFSFLLGIFTKGTSPVVQTMFSELTHKDHYNKVYSLSEVTIGLSAAIIIVLIGLVADKFGIVNVFYVCAVFAVIATIPIYFFSKHAVKQENVLKAYEIE